MVDTAAGLIDELLGRCPGVTVLATSREALAVPEELQIAVGPLAGGAGGNAGRRRCCSSRPASSSSSGLGWSAPAACYGEEELLAMGRIARALDGIPLALELAAARASTMSVTDVADRLDLKFALLTSGHAHCRCPSADPAGSCRLELRPSQRAGAIGVQQARGVPWCWTLDSAEWVVC